MIKEILEIRTPSDLVVNRDVLDRISKADSEYVLSQNPVIVTDARSSAFRAFGIAKQLPNSKTVLLMDGTAIESTYTALTEMFFQEIPLLVIAVFQKGEDFSLGYLERCCDVLNAVREDDAEDGFQFEEHRFKPTVLPVILNQKTEKTVDYGYILDELDSLLSSDDILFCYEPELKKEYSYEIKAVSRRYKYGTLSKYMGYSLVSPKRCLLLITPDIIDIDINIFNNRYLSDKVKIIVFGTENYDEMKTWLESNGFEIRLADKKNFSRQADEMLNQAEGPSVIFVDKDKD